MYGSNARSFVAENDLLVTRDYQKAYYFFLGREENEVEVSRDGENSRETISRSGRVF